MYGAWDSSKGPVSMVVCAFHDGYVYAVDEDDSNNQDCYYGGILAGTYVNPDV